MPSCKMEYECIYQPMCSLYVQMYFLCPIAFPFIAVNIVYSFILSLFISLVSASTLAQQVNLTLQGPQADSFRILSNLPSTYPSLSQATEQLHIATLELISKGYLAASIDSIFTNEDPSSIHAHVQLGHAYQYVAIRNGNVPPALLQQFRFDEKTYVQKPISPKSLLPLFKKIITHFEENGYPFARIQLDSIIDQHGQISAAILLHQGPLMKLDTIIIHDDANISRHFLLKYLGLKQHQPYKESQLRQISTRIRELNFITESYPWRMDFTTTRNTLNLFVKNKNANRADILLGMMPSNDEIGGRFLLSGDVKMAFANALGYGEQIQLNWQNLQYRSPRYDLQFSLPYLFQSVFGLTGRFDFFKKDSTFRTTQGELGLLYQPHAQQYFKLFYELSSSRAITINIDQLIATRRLPTHGDISYRTLGIESFQSKLDYRLNPRKGHSLRIQAGVSFRTMSKNTSVENTFDPITGESFAYLYDTLQLRNYKYNLKAELYRFSPLAKKWTLATLYNAGITLSDNPLFRNEVFQIGGYRLLRGFDEGSLFVDHYQVFTLEPRYLLSQNSYFFLFTDAAYLHSRFIGTPHQFAYGTGLGMSFETRAGFFNLSYALGGRTDAPLLFRNSKIHFGYINVF